MAISCLIVRKENRIVKKDNDQIDHPVTISRRHITIAKETFLIFKRPGSNEDEPVDHFIKTITIAGNHKSIFIKRKNTITKRNNQKDLSGNRFYENILQEAENKLKEDKGFFPEAENIFQEDSIGMIISEKKLKEDENNLK